LRRRFPNAKFLGVLQNAPLAGHLAAADVFVFPSRTDTFGVVQLEALASGVPVAAFPVTGPRDLIGESGVGVLSDDLRTACLAALRIPRETCRAFALMRSWENSARQFIGHVQKVAASARRETKARSLANTMETADGKSHAGLPGTTYAES
jgi:glycosyltransferase involved in cell wall biosynthesis